jgi:hypothetical protein
VLILADVSLIRDNVYIVTVGRRHDCQFHGLIYSCMRYSVILMVRIKREYPLHSNDCCELICHLCDVHYRFSKFKNNNELIWKMPIIRKVIQKIC